jgi:hypothetical protein
MSSQNLNLLPSIERLVKDYVKGVYGVELDTLVSNYNNTNNLNTHIENLNTKISATRDTVREILVKHQEKKSDDAENLLTNAYLKTMTEKKKVSAKAKCIHPIAKGEKKGQPCGTGVCDESKTGKYCKKHLAQEGKENEPEKVVPVKAAATKKAKEEQPLNKFTKEELKEKIEKRTTEIEVRRNKFGNWEHQGSGILIDRDTRRAFAKQNPDGTQSPLTSEDIDLCKSIGFKYVLPDNIVSNENDDDEDEDMEDDDLDIDEDIDDEDMDD